MTSWWTVGVGAVVGYIVIYLYQYQKQLPSKTEYDKSAEKVKLKCIKKRSLAADYVFRPIKIGGVTFRNRIIKSATFESASYKGKVTDKLIEFHKKQALNAAMVTVSYGCVSFEGRTFPDQLLILPENKDGLIKLTTTIHRESNAKISIQLTHAGLMAEPFYDEYTQKYATSDIPKGKIVSVSNLWSWSAFQFAKQLTIEDINKLINKFGESALLCKQCGFDAITVHCGHGYLISQFLSCITNKRNDEYGKELIESRCKFAIDIIKKIRKLCGNEFPIFVKMNSHDGVDQGITVQESIQFCQLLLKNGADVIIPTAGFILNNGIFMMRGNVPIYKMVIESSSWIKKIGIGLVGPWLIPNIKFRSMFLWETSLKLLNGIKESEGDKEEAIVAYLGGITSLQDMNKAFESGFEFVAMGRALLREPDFLDKIKENSSHISLCDHQNRCIIGQMSGKPLRCYAIDHHNDCSKDIEDLK